MKKLYTIILAIIMMGPVVAVAGERQKAPADGEWVPAGTGMYRDDLITILRSVSTVYTWEVPFEKNGDWYRFQPYAVPGNPVAKILGLTDKVYVYVNVADPDKVYVDTFYPYSSSVKLGFSTFVPENDEEWEEGQGYGKIVDNVVSWRPSSDEDITWLFIDNSDDDWYPCSYQTEGVAIALPGGELPVYSLETIVPTSVQTDEIEVTFKPSEDVAHVYYKAIKGSFNVLNGSNPYLVMETGTELAQGEEVTVKVKLAEGEGAYTVSVVAVDADNELRVVTNNYLVYRDLSDDNWVYAGSTLFYEDLYAQDRGLANQTATVTVQKDLNHPGHIRLVDPFRDLKTFVRKGQVIQEPGDYNLYFDISNPTQVILEPSLTGINAGDGYGLLWGFAGMYLEAAADEEEYEDRVEYAEEVGWFGYIEDGILYMDQGTVYISESEFEGGEFMGSRGTIEIMLPEEALGVESVSITSDENAPAAYYNLQGVRIESPAAGNVYIRVRGDKADKVRM